MQSKLAAPAAGRTRPGARAGRLRGLVAMGVRALVAGSVLAGCQKTETVNRGYRGLAMVQLYKPAGVAALSEINQIPPPEEPADPDSPSVNEVTKNVHVLNDLSATEFARLMNAMATWVAPDDGCDYCHNSDNLESDEKYTKVVARRMLQMTRTINTKWKDHVGSTGVTCWTCHRGQAVPSGDWFADLGPNTTVDEQMHNTGKNSPAPNAANSALPRDPLSVYLTTSQASARVIGSTALATGNRHSIKETEWTYSLMLYISKSLGVNCTYCHNTRAMAVWDESTPQRVTAWYGIQMVRDLNTSFLIPLQPKFPPKRLSPTGDGPKIGCATCHKGTYKPLYGVSMLPDYPVLRGAVAPTAEGAAPSAPLAHPNDVSTLH
jgi:photosynthetic reaction center cytochrome c subunit